MIILAELPGVPMKSFNVKDINTGEWLAEALMVRWNHQECKIYQHALGGKEKRLIAHIENFDYNPEKPSLTEDNIVPISVSKPERKKKEKVASSAPKSSGGGSSSNHKVPLTAIAEKVGKETTVLRRKLRKSDIEKPAGGWGWDSWNDPAVLEILSWR